MDNTNNLCFVVFSKNVALGYSKCYGVYSSYEKANRKAKSIAEQGFNINFAEMIKVDKWEWVSTDQALTLLIYPTSIDDNIEKEI